MAGPLLRAAAAGQGSAAARASTAFCTNSYSATILGDLVDPYGKSIRLAPAQRTVSSQRLNQHNS